MKKILRYSVLILLTVFVSFISCNKEPVSSVVTPPPPPPPPPPPGSGKTIKIRVVEYNNGNPIAGALISLRPDYPNTSTQNLTTDGDGVINFVTSTNKFGYISVTKPGYWSLLPNYDFASPIIFYPDSAIYNPTASFYSSDSFVIKLFPIWNATVHIKDTSGTSVNAHFLCQGIFNLNGNTYQSYGSYIPLSAHIDTTFQLQVFGNTNNKFGIWACGGDDDCFMMAEILNKVQYIANGTNVTMNIFY